MYSNSCSFARLIYGNVSPSSNSAVTNQLSIAALSSRSGRPVTGRIVRRRVLAVAYDTLCNATLSLDNATTACARPGNRHSNNEIARNKSVSHYQVRIQVPVSNIVPVRVRPFARKPFRARLRANRSAAAAPERQERASIAGACPCRSRAAGCPTEVANESIGDIAARIAIRHAVSVPHVASIASWMSRSTSLCAPRRAEDAACHGYAARSRRSAACTGTLLRSKPRAAGRSKPDRASVLFRARRSARNGSCRPSLVTSLTRTKVDP
jgi:hypothetical protein